MPDVSTPPRLDPDEARRSARGLAWLFGAIYFVQGVAEPVEGLIAQPVKSLLKTWGRTDAQITDFAAMVAIPWSLKPLFGLLTDFVPLFRSRRRNYLIASTAATALGLGAVYFLPTDRPSTGALLGWLLVPTAAVAFSDVVADALMIEAGRPRGLTGRLQGVQWACMYAATIATGLVGGWLSQIGAQRMGFAICAALSAGTLLLTIRFVRDEPIDHLSPGATFRALARVARSRGLWGVAAFLFLWNFNPFSDAVLYLYVTRALGMSEEFRGLTVSIFAASCLAASILYARYCRRFAIRTLVHASIALGVVASLAYWGLTDRLSAMVVTVVAGLAYMTATLIQLDLAARHCPPEVAGTAFAMLMAMENTASISSTWLGGRFYAWGGERWGSVASFNSLVALGAATTAACWLLVPILPGEEGPHPPMAEAPL